jgi:two-component system invasion response regulator UvrY
MIKVLIADDHAVVRRGLIQILSEGFPGAVFGQASDGEEVLLRIREQKWSLLTLDIGMPGRSGVDLLRDIRTSDPRLPVLVLTVQNEGQYARRALKSGAAGYLCKDTAPLELINAARSILKRGRYVSSTLAEQLASDLATKPKEFPHELLSDRELEVMRMMASGKTITKIADILALSAKTISTYRQRILTKMGLTTTADLIRYAIENRLFG